MPFQSIVCRERYSYRLPATGGGHRAGPPPPLVGPKVNELQTGDSDQPPSATAGIGPPQSPGEGSWRAWGRMTRLGAVPGPWNHSVCAVTWACAASSVSYSDNAPGRTRTCNTATCAAYRPASAMECCRYTTGDKMGLASPTWEEHALKNRGCPETGPSSPGTRK